MVFGGGLRLQTLSLGLAVGKGFGDVGFGDGVGGFEVGDSGGNTDDAKIGTSGKVKAGGGII